MQKQDSGHRRSSIICILLSLVLAVSPVISPVEAADVGRHGFASKKIAQKKLSLKSTTSTAYVHRTMGLTVSGGSGSGKISYKVISGKCVYNPYPNFFNKGEGRGLYSLEDKPGTCLIQATKAADSKYLATKSNVLAVGFLYLPGKWKSDELENWIILEGGAWTWEGRASAPDVSSYLTKIIAASKDTGVRYAPYWSKLKGFLDARKQNLNSAISILETRAEAQAAAGLNEAAMSTRNIVQVQKAILSQMNSVGDLTFFYMRDMENGFY